MPYPEDYASMIDLVSQKLQDTGNAVWTDAELLLYMTEELREVSQYSPHIYMVEYTLETRRGTATSGTTTNTLDDDVNDQFVSGNAPYGDVGKIVFNTTDRTWAYITAVTDADTVVLSNDIMVSGEGYRIFHKNCNHQKEIYIGEMPDWLWIDRIEFPAMEDPPNYVKWIDRGRNVIRLDIDDEPDDTKNSDAKDQVWIFFAMRHKLSQLLKTDYVSDTPATTTAVGATTIHIDAATTAETIERGQEFTIADERARAIYICTVNVTMSSNEGDLKFWPPLESSVADGAAITFVSSTLTPKLEGIYADLVAGKAAMNKARAYITTIGPGPNRYRNMYEWGKLKYEDAKRELEGLRGYSAPSVCLP